MKNIIEVRDFSIRFGGREILKNVHFTLKERECVAVVGASGVGKTTFLRALIGLVKPSSGDIIIDGESIVSMTERELIPIRKKVACAFQNGALFDSMTVFENVAFPLREHTSLKQTALEKKVMAALKEFGLAEAKGLYPSALSGGMKKRAGIARAVILKPKVALYDEPTVSLDPYSSANLVKTMLYLKKKGMASVLVTHDMPLALKISDRLALLMDGCIKAEGSPETLEKSHNVLIRNFIDGVKE